MVTNPCPGSVLVLKNAPDVGMWTVISFAVTIHPGPFDLLHMLLLNRSMLKNESVERSQFTDKWDIVHAT